MPPLDVILWVFLAAYIVHIIDETVIGEGFTRKIQVWFWPQYHIGMFFWFNFGCITAIALSNTLYDLFGGHWVVLALLWPFGFATHGVTLHLWWSIRHRAYFSGLLTSPLYWIIVYFIVRYAYRPVRSAIPIFSGASRSGSASSAAFSPSRRRTYSRRSLGAGRSPAPSRNIRPPSRRLTRGQAAVDHELGTGDEARLVGGEVDDHVGDLFGLRDAPERNLRPQRACTRATSSSLRR